MGDARVRRALIAVHDKTGVADFARALVEEFGIEIVSTGGTAKHLKEAGVSVTPVEAVTGFPEMLDGRVKTLHPRIHAAILADRDNPEHMRQLAEQGIKPIDMVVVNLYPFEETIKRPDCGFDDAIEMIDIGGPCLLRAAAKNHRHVVVCSHWRRYGAVMDALRRWDDRGCREQVLREGAEDAFWGTAVYDSVVRSWLAAQAGALGDDRLLGLTKARALRYGENPHQTGGFFAVYGDPRCNKLVCEVTQGEQELSFNNLVDADAALGLCAELSLVGVWDRLIAGPTPAGTDPTGASISPVVVFIKHTNACGVGIAGDRLEAYRRAYLGDPNAAMGGILAVNFHVDIAFAEAVMASLARWGKAAGAGAFFVEVWLAPTFDDAAIEVIRSRKKWGRRVRLLDVGDLSAPPDAEGFDFKRIAGGMLMQTRDRVALNEDAWTVVTERVPTDVEMADLRLAWLVCKHTKSNAITICKEGMLIGNGAGQMSRVMSCRIATWLARENGHAERVGGASAASDAFFPFRDGPDLLADAGVTALIQPGGSKRDAETIAACDERGVAMIFTGTRHFKH